jgi:hypothetical protein
MAVWGDGSLWYVLADANGLTSSSVLEVGQTLVVPNVVANIHNNASTFKVYNPGELIGDTTPTLPDPPPPPRPYDDKCFRIVATIIVVVVTIVVAIYATEYLSEWSKLGAAIIGAAAGDAAGQVTAKVLGLREHFSWREVGTAALTAGLTYGVGGTGSVVTDALLKNVVAQGVSIARGQQEKFDWAALAAASINSYVDTQTSGVSNATSTVGPTLDGFTSDLLSGATKGLVSSGMSILINRRGKIDWANIAANALGGAIGNAIAASIPTVQDARVRRQEAQREDYERQGYQYEINPNGSLRVTGTSNTAMVPTTGLGGGLRPTSEQVAAWGPQFESASNIPAWAAPDYGLLPMGEAIPRLPTQVGDASTEVNLSAATEARVQQGQTMLDFGDPYASGGDLSADTTGAIRRSGRTGELLVDPQTGKPSFFYTSRLDRMQSDAEEQKLRDQEIAQSRANAPSLTAAGDPRLDEMQRQRTLTNLEFALVAPAAAGLAGGLTGPTLYGNAISLYRTGAALLPPQLTSYAEAALPYVEKAVVGAFGSAALYTGLHGQDSTLAGMGVAALGGGLVAAPIRYGLNSAAGVADYSMWTLASSRTLPTLPQAANLGTGWFYGQILTGVLNSNGATSSGQSYWTTPVLPNLYDQFIRNK